MSTPFSNMPYLRQQFSALLGNTSSIVKIICCIIIFGYFLSFIDETLEFLGLTPGYLISLDIWKITTFWTLELHILDVLADIVTVGMCGKLIEPLWGPVEMLKFFLITNFGVAILSCLYYFFLFSITQNTDILFDTQIHGLTGYIAGVAVAVRQIMPDHLIIKTGIGKFTNRNIPLTILCVSIVMWAIGLLDGIHPVMFCSGLIVSWVYLRFYQKHSNNSRGDSAENFSFASFFPNVLQPVISIIVNPIYLCCLRLSIVKRPTLASSSQASLTSVNVSFPGSDDDPHGNDRRRKIALKALSERLSKSTDSSRQNLLPKSYPSSSKHQQHSGHSHHGQHQHHQHQHHSHDHSGGHSHSHQHSSHNKQHQHQAHEQHTLPQGLPPNVFMHNNEMVFMPPMIALPAPPVPLVDTSTPNDSQNFTINVDASSNPNPSNDPNSSSV